VIVRVVDRREHGIVKRNGHSHIASKQSPDNLRR
jgi:hypothetical protein